MKKKIKNELEEVEKEIGKIEEGNLELDYRNLLQEENEAENYRNY